MTVLIATPTAGNVVTTALVSSVVSATIALNEAGHRYGQMVLDGSDIVLARNYFANLVLRSPAFSHLLFIDSDMLIGTDVFRRLLAADLPIVGVVYPEKKLDRERYAALLAEGMPEARARAQSVRFNVRTPGNRLDLREGFALVEGMGFGCVLLRRDLLERMAASPAVAEVTRLKYRQEFGWESHRDFFAPIVLEDGDHLSEDYAFCARVRALGDVPIAALIDGEIAHIGQQAYAAEFRELLQRKD